MAARLSEQPPSHDIACPSAAKGQTYRDIYGDEIWARLRVEQLRYLCNNLYAGLSLSGSLSFAISGAGAPPICRITSNFLSILNAARICWLRLLYALLAHREARFIPFAIGF
jgi:hypothetical protein